MIQNYIAIFNHAYKTMLKNYKENRLTGNF